VRFLIRDLRASPLPVDALGYSSQFNNIENNEFILNGDTTITSIPYFPTANPPKFAPGVARWHISGILLYSIFDSNYPVGSLPIPQVTRFNLIQANTFTSIGVALNGIELRSTGSACLYTTRVLQGVFENFIIGNDLSFVPMSFHSSDANEVIGNTIKNVRNTEVEGFDGVQFSLSGIYFAPISIWVETGSANCFKENTVIAPANIYGLTFGPVDPDSVCTTGFNVAERNTLVADCGFGIIENNYEQEVATPVHGFLSLWQYNFIGNDISSCTVEDEWPVTGVCTTCEEDSFPPNSYFSIIDPPAHWPLSTACSPDLVGESSSREK